MADGRYSRPDVVTACRMDNPGSDLWTSMSPEGNKFKRLTAHAAHPCVSSSAVTTSKVSVAVLRAGADVAFVLAEPVAMAAATCWKVDVGFQVCLLLWLAF